VEIKTMPQSEARFRDMAEVSSDRFWETGADHRFSYISQGFQGMLQSPHSAAG
jgi:hypothetical protein